MQKISDLIYIKYTNPWVSHIIYYWLTKFEESYKKPLSDKFLDPNIPQNFIYPYNA